MPDQTVQVTFDLNASPQFTFTPPSVTMTAAGKIILLQHPAGQPWVFALPGAIVKDDTHVQFSAVVQGDGRSVQITDLLRDPRGHGKVTYHYNCTILIGNERVTSPDPDIVNDPGSIMKT